MCCTYAYIYVCVCETNVLVYIYRICFLAIDDGDFICSTYVAVPNIFGVSEDTVAEEYPQGGNVDSYCVSRCSKEKIRTILKN